MAELSVFEHPEVAGAIVRLLRKKHLEVDLDLLGRVLAETPDELISLCHRNVVGLRTLEALEESGVPLGREARAWLGQERERIERGLVAIATFTELFERRALPFMVIKTGDHYPDQGHDIDIFVAADGGKAAKILREEMGASPLERSVSEVLSAKTNWRIGAATIEVHAGRLGQVGEHLRLADELFRCRRRERIGSVDTYVPSLEGRVILALLQRIYRHYNFRICDVVNVASLFEDGSLNRDLLWRLCRDSGILYGVGIGVGMVADLLSRLDDHLPLGEGDPVSERCRYALSFRRGHYRFPLRSVVPRVFTRQLASCLGHRKFLQSGRLAFLGLLMAFVGLNITVFPGIPIWRKLW